MLKTNRSDPSVAFGNRVKNGRRPIFKNLDVVWARCTLENHLHKVVQKLFAAPIVTVVVKASITFRLYVKLRDAVFRCAQTQFVMVTASTKGRNSLTVTFWQVAWPHSEQIRFRFVPGFNACDDLLARSTLGE